MWVPKFAEFETLHGEMDRGMEQAYTGIANDDTAAPHCSRIVRFRAGLAARSPRTRAVRPARADRGGAEGRQARLLLANVAESEQPVINAFNKRFPFIKIEFLRAPGNQLLQRVKTEAAAGKLLADVIDHSDRSLMLEIENLFQDYAPPNAADYIPETRVSPKLWPRSTVVWAIAYNSELVKNPPKTWMDLTKPEYGSKQIGNVIAPSGGTTWTRAMFERQVVAEDYWKKQAATQPMLFPSNAPTSDALVRGEITVAALLYNAIFPKLRDGAPVKVFFAPEGAPITPFAAGIPKTAANPNAARLFLNWCLSEEGQAAMIKLGRQSHLAEAGAALSGRLRSEGREGVGAELRPVREAAAPLARRVEQDLRISAVSLRLALTAPRKRRGSSSVKRPGSRIRGDKRDRHRVRDSGRN